MEFSKETWPSDRWPNFSFEEMRCQETGACLIDEGFMDMLQATREAAGRGFHVTSGFRSPEHSIEAKKEKLGAHTYGKAVDIACSGELAHEIARLAFYYGFTGIGLKQVGPLLRRFIHLDSIVEADDYHGQRPWVWTY